jgi:hypothetical protein
MENRPVITLTGYSPAPGADVAAFERYQKWSAEVYGPLNLKIPEVSSCASYKIIRQNPEYPMLMSMIFYRNITNWSGYAPNSIGTDIIMTRGHGKNAALPREYGARLIL